MVARSVSCRLLLGFAMVFIACTTVLPAGMAQEEQQGRKIQKQVQPEYPELARRAHVAGVVRIEVVVAPNGTPKSTSPLGGNPVLIEAAQQALKSWRWEPAAKDSTQIVQFRFQAD